MPLPPMTRPLLLLLPLLLCGCYIPGSGWTMRSGFDFRTHRKPALFVEMVDTRWDESNRIAVMNAMPCYPDGGLAGGPVSSPYVPHSTAPPPHTLPPPPVVEERRDDAGAQAPAPWRNSYPPLQPLPDTRDYTPPRELPGPTARHTGTGAPTPQATPVGPWIPSQQAPPAAPLEDDLPLDTEAGTGAVPADYAEDLLSTRMPATRRRDAAAWLFHPLR